MIEVKSVRQELDEELKKLERAQNLIVCDPEIMRGTPVYRGTRIPVELIADMLSQGTNWEEILEGYPALDREKVELASLYVQAFPRRGRPFPVRGQNGNRFSLPGIAALCGVTVKLLIDECLHTSLVELAHAAGHVADHVNYLGLGAERLATDRHNPRPRLHFRHQQSFRFLRFTDRNPCMRESSSLFPASRLLASENSSARPSNTSAEEI